MQTTTSCTAISRPLSPVPTPEDFQAPPAQTIPEPPCNAANNGTGAGNPLFCANPSAPDRKQPYREITIIYHEVGQIATQAFPCSLIRTMVEHYERRIRRRLRSTTARAASARRFTRTASVLVRWARCVDCKFEEFFLSAWSVGDPAMLVDRPANSSVLPRSRRHRRHLRYRTIRHQRRVARPRSSVDTGQPPDPNCANARDRRRVNGFPYTLQPLAKATRAYYPDDPSNVYHSYINDHLKFRILHGGTVATHVHHQHAHQWLQSPNSDQGSYLDSQMISPGASYTLEMTFNGSGNRNKVVGDSIFPLPLLSALRGGHVGHVAHARYV